MKQKRLVYTSCLIEQKFDVSPDVEEAGGQLGAYSAWHLHIKPLCTSSSLQHQSWSLPTFRHPYLHCPQKSGLSLCEIFLSHFLPPVLVPLPHSKRLLQFFLHFGLACSSWLPVPFIETVTVFWCNFRRYKLTF